jgi:Tfp pilus assembly protein PilO
MSAISRLSQKSQFVILGLLVLALCGVFYVYMIRPLQAELADLNLQIQNLEAEVAAGQGVRDQLDELKQAVQEQQARLTFLRQVLPEKKQTAEIIRQVQQMAVDSNLKINSFTPRATVNNEFYEDWPIMIALEGNYDSLGTFFERVGAFTRIINVDNINIKALDDDASRNRTLSATCTATTFVYLENETAGPVEEAK